MYTGKFNVKLMFKKKQTNLQIAPACLQISVRQESRQTEIESGEAKMEGTEGTE